MPTHGADNGDSKAHSRSYDFAMARVLVGATLKADEWDGQAIHGWRKKGGSMWAAVDSDYGILTAGWHSLGAIAMVASDSN